jgi:hypothetical protein
MRSRDSNNTRAGIIGGTTILIMLLAAVALAMVLIWVLGG